MSDANTNELKIAAAISAALMPSIEIAEALIEAGLLPREALVARIERLLATAPGYAPNDAIVRPVWTAVLERLRSA